MLMKPGMINQQILRVENRRKILRLLIRKREVTIADISRETHISIPTVTKNIQQLIKEGIVEDAGVSEAAIGRKPMLARFLPDAYYAIGVGFSAESVRIILTNLDSTIKADTTLGNPDFHDIDGLMMRIRQEVDRILLEKDVSVDSVLGIGFSLPGPTNEETKVLKFAPNHGMQHVEFTQYESAFEFPLFVENDANAAAVAELTLGIARSMRNLVYIYIMPQGIGCGIVVEGHLYRGRSKRSGEISHMRVASHGRQCPCGWQDCWELYASLDELTAMYHKKTGNTVQNIQEFFMALKKYELAAVEVFTEYLEYVAVGIQHIILILDPDYVVIGGDLSRYEEFFLEPLKERIVVENRFYDNSTVNIICSTLKENAFVLGASLLPLDRIFHLYDI